MGIPGLFEHVGKLQRISLAKLAVEHFEQHGRKLRLAIDASIWLFQAKASMGGFNPELRTIYFRLLRLMRLGIDPVFVFDGPLRPSEKRNKKINASWESRRLPQLRKLLDLFGFVHHNAPGEAEAECAFLQREKVVDIVLSEDGDTLMFGATVTIRNWSSEERRTSDGPTHVDLLHAAKIAEEQLLTREGMILIALMSGGDYDTVGIKGCGSTIAYEAARAGFGAELCHTARASAPGLESWRQRLQTELRRNTSGFFKRRHPKVADSIDSSFPCMRIVDSYLMPEDSSLSDISDLQSQIQQPRHVAVQELRAFLRDKLEWANRPGAVKIIRGLAPALLTYKLLDPQDDCESTELLSVCGARIHHSSDGIQEVRVEFRPTNIVAINLADETPSKADNMSSSSSQAEQGLAIGASQDEGDQEFESGENVIPGRTLTQPYDPSALTKLYVPRLYVHRGCRQELDKWHTILTQPKPISPRKSKPKASKFGTGMKPGAIEAFFPVSRSVAVSEAEKAAETSGSRPSAVSRKKPRPTQNVTETNSSINPWTLAKRSTPTEKTSDDKHDVGSLINYQALPTPGADLMGTAPGSSSLNAVIGPSDQPNGTRQNKSIAGIAFAMVDDKLAIDHSQETPISRSPLGLAADVNLRDKAQKPQQEPRAKNINVRIRESLPGAWATSSPSEERRPGAVYRSVEIVDLT